MTIDIRDKLNTRRAIDQYIKLMEIADLHAKDVEANPGPHIDRLVKEVVDLRTWISRIHDIVYPSVEFVDGRSQYPEALDMTAEMSKRLQGVEFTLACYEQVNKKELKNE